MHSCDQQEIWFLLFQIRSFHNELSLIGHCFVREIIEDASSVHEAQAIDSEDPLFILYTSGSTGKPKGMLHTTAGYMVYTAYTFNNVFAYEDLYVGVYT